MANNHSGIIIPCWRLGYFASNGNRIILKCAIARTAPQFFLLLENNNTE